MLKVKVTESFNAKFLSAQYLENIISDSHRALLKDKSWPEDDP